MLQQGLLLTVQFWWNFHLIVVDGNRVVVIVVVNKCCCDVLLVKWTSWSHQQRVEWSQWAAAAFPSVQYVVTWQLWMSTNWQLVSWYEAHVSPIMNNVLIVSFMFMRVASWEAVLAVMFAEMISMMSAACSLLPQSLVASSDYDFHTYKITTGQTCQLCSLWHEYKYKLLMWVKLEQVWHSQSLIQAQTLVIQSPSEKIWWNCWNVLQKFM